MLVAMLVASTLMFAFWWIFGRVIRWNYALKRVAHELGILHFPSGLTVKGFASGTTRGLRVTVDTRWKILNPFRWVEVLLPGGERPFQAFTRVTVWLRDADERLTLEKRPCLEGLVLKQYFDDDVLTADERFDAAVRAHGPPDELLAMLSAHARETACITIGELDARLADGQILLEKPGYIDDGKLLTVLAKACVRLGAAMKANGLEPSRRLFERFDQDPSDAVRRRALSVLLSRHPASPSARDAANMVLEAADPELKPGAEDLEARLIALLGRRDAPLVREAAAWGLGQIGTDDAAEALAAVRDAEDTDEDLAAICRRALAALHSDQSSLMSSNAAALPAIAEPINSAI